MSELPPNDERFYLGRTTISVKNMDKRIPRIDVETVSDYAGLARANFFHIAKHRNGALTYVEDWERVPVVQRVDLATEIGGTPLSSYPLDHANPDDLASQTPVYFMKDEEDDFWKEVEFDATQGETQFMRLMSIKSVATGDVKRVASILDQRIARISEYEYHPNGQIARVVTKDRATDFAPVEEHYSP